MNLTWLGTAGFLVNTKEGEIAFDPFLSRKKKSPFSVRSFQNVRAVFVGHGHFDHTFDIPEIASHSDLSVFAPGLTGRLLRMRGLRATQLKTSNPDEILFKPLKLRAFRSAHVRFDLPLIFSTIKRCGVGDCFNIMSLGLGYPKGLVQTYFFEVSGKKILFASSAGCTELELKIYRDLEVDFFLAPLQGHSKIQEIVAEQVSIINPKVVIPHHYDNFYPPLSQNISVEVFREELKKKDFKGELLEIPLFSSVNV